MAKILMEKYYFCKNRECMWFGPWNTVLWKSDDGLLENEKKTCPKCGGHFFEEKLIDYKPPKIVLYQCQECGDVFKEKFERTQHQSEKHGLVWLDD